MSAFSKLNRRPKHGICKVSNESLLAQLSSIWAVASNR